MGVDESQYRIGSIETMGCSKPLLMDVDEHPWSLQISFNVKASASFHYIGNENSPVYDMFQTLKRAEITNARGVGDIDIPRLIEAGETGEAPDTDSNGLHCKLVDSVALAPSGTTNVNVNGTAEMNVRMDARGPDASPENRFEYAAEFGAQISGSLAILGPKKVEQLKEQAKSGDEPEPITVNLDVHIGDSNSKVIQHEAPENRVQTASAQANNDIGSRPDPSLTEKLTQIQSHLDNIEESANRFEERIDVQITDVNHLVTVMNAMADSPSQLEPETIAEHLDIDPDEPLDFDTQRELIEDVAMMSRLTPIEYEKAKEQLDGGSLQQLEANTPPQVANKDMPKPPEPPPDSVLMPG